MQLERDWPPEQRRRRQYPGPDLPFPAVAADSVPWLSVEQMREVDRLMIDEFAITLEQMMENAGRNLALLARHLLGGDASGRRVLVLAGGGGNGGGGLVAARHLVVAGARVSLTLAAPSERLAPVTRRQYDALTRLEQIDPEQARIVELRYFAGLSIDETADALGLSPATLKRRWALARAWLFRDLSGAA